MEQGTLRTPNLLSFARLTGNAIFYPDDETGGRNLGNIVMTKIPYSPTKVELDIAVDGDLVATIQETSMIKPVFEITGNQFHSAIQPLVLLGTPGTDDTQTLATGVTLAMTSHAGKTQDLGARNVTNVVVKILTVTKVEGTDYFLEANKGTIRFPDTPTTGIPDGSTLAITYDKPLLVRSVITPFNRLNRTGTLVLYMMSNKTPTVYFEWNMPGNLSADSGVEGDPKKFSEWLIKFTTNSTAATVKIVKTA